MNAIEELRKYISELSCEIRNDEGTLQQTLYGDPCLRKIADRIEDEYMELPRDFNGEVIHVGDTVKFDGDTYEVFGIANNEHIIVYDVNGLGIGMRSGACELVTPEPDSMERIKADVETGLCEYFGFSSHDKTGKACPSCPSTRISKNCHKAKMLDLIARTEKLLGGE